MAEDNDTLPTRAPRKDKALLSVKCYGGKAALSWENDESKSGDEFRVSVQGAPSTGPQQYNWKAKVVIQLTEAEVIKTLAVFMGISPKFEAGQHGAEKDKTFSIEAQSGKFFGKVMQKGKGLFAVPIEPVDAVKVAALLCRQIHKNNPWMDANGLQNLIRGVMTTAAKAPARSA